MQGRIGIFILILSGIFLAACVWNDTERSPDYLALDDSEYPYADLPRLVIETDDFAQIRNREDKIPALLQIYGKSGPESDVMNLTVKGRGHSSFTMAKYSIKLKFNEKQALFGMPQDKEWDLVSNQRDKSLLRNYITYQLAKILKDDYAPRSQFVEVFLNREYIGVYQLVEHQKVSEDRINIPKNDSSFFFEKTREFDDGDVFFKSHMGHTFVIKYPKDADSNAIGLLKGHVDDFEQRLKKDDLDLSEWIDIDDFVRYYWIQEFSKNIDGAFGRSIFITWQYNSPFQMGPVWDFDVAYGIGNTRMMSPNDWYVRYQGWYTPLLKNKTFKDRANQYWKDNRHYFVDLADSIESAKRILEKAATNEFKRWPVLENDEHWPFVAAYKSYDEAIDSLQSWVKQRVDWIDKHL